MSVQPEVVEISVKDELERVDVELIDEYIDRENATSKRHKRALFQEKRGDEDDDRDDAELAYPGGANGPRPAPVSFSWSMSSRYLRS